VIWFIILLLFSYDLFLIWIFVGWRKLKLRPSASQEKSFISVIVPVRNEVGNIERLLDDLEKQSYSQNKYEVLIIDDQSTDETRQRVLDRKERSEIHVTLVTLNNPTPQSLSSKKAAITLGVEMARGDLIILTDGDSRVGENWLRTYAQYFDVRDLKLMAGLVFIEPDGSFFSKIQTAEFASLIGSGASLFSLGFPALCNGANLAFTREVFLEVEGYKGNEGIISGDDEYLLSKIRKYHPGKIRFLKSREAIVNTPPSKNLTDFFQQRKRWAGKWKKPGNKTIIILAGFIFFIHSGILTGFIWTLLGKIPLLIFVVLIFVKILLEYLLIHDIFTFANKKMNIWAFLVSTILYAPYAVFFGIAANIGGYTWKGRRYKN
jgi:biofilm PGA synthesis N-glycosyltransferase PgaC